MWQLLAFSSICFGSIESLIDKIVVVSNKASDTVLVSFTRNLIFFGLITLTGISGIFGVLHFFFNWIILILALLSLGSAIFYTYMLKHIELTGAEAIAYVIPFLFLLIDFFILKSPISTAQVYGIFLLVTGGLLFTINAKTRHFKREYTKYVWGIFAFYTLLDGTEYYAFKYYHSLNGLNEVSYLMSTYLLVILGFIAIVCYQKKWRMMPAVAVRQHFLLKETGGKIADVMASVLWLRALTLTEVSRVNAFNSFAPLILLVLLYISEKRFNLNAGEKFGGVHIFQKSAATILLLAGAWLAK